MYSRKSMTSWQALEFDGPGLKSSFDHYIWDLRFCCLIFMNLFHWTWHWLAWDFPCVFPFNLPFPHSTTLYLCNYLILVPPTGWILCTSRQAMCAMPLVYNPSFTSHPIFICLTHPSDLSVNATYFHWSFFFFFTFSLQSKLSCLSLPIFL